MLAQLPPPIVSARRQMCGSCDCALDFADPCATCPKNRWKQNMCEFPMEEVEAERTFQQKHQLPFPNIREIALNLTTAVTSEVKARVSGKNQLELNEIEKRYAICESCEFFYAPSKRCKKCGCFLKWKTAWRSQSCPIGKW